MRTLRTRRTRALLLSEADPRGRSPVDIPAAGDPGTIPFPFGHGLTY